MVGCTIFTLPPPCFQILPWWLPSAKPFELGPFSLERQVSTAWGPSDSWFWLPKVNVEVAEYSFILLVCDVLLTVAWHVCTKYIVVRPQFRLKFLSPSVRFTFGVLFGAFRLWVIAHLRPTLFYFFLARLCFFVYLLLGLAALVFDDGPWRNVRPNARDAFNRDSILNPCAAVNRALAVSVSKLTLARPAVRRTLESGKKVTIVLDLNGSLLYARRGSLEVRDAINMRRSNTRCIVELVCRHENCTSGYKPFFGFLQGAPFQNYGVRGMSSSQKASLLELLLNLNDCQNLQKLNDKFLSAAKPDVKWFQLPKQVAVALRDKELEEEEEEERNRGTILNFYKM